MKAIWLAALIGPLLGAAVYADPVVGSVPGDHACVTGGAGLSHVSYTLPTSPDCCDGKLRCTQLLSTSILQRTHRSPRT